MRSRFGERVQKLPLHAGFTCPNRDGMLGRGGCHFCSVNSFSDESEAALDLQLARGREKIDRARRFLAYFQAYTNTYAEVERLRALYDAALESYGVVGLCVGTRPDCVPDAVLDLLAGYRDQGAEVWLELGLQSAFDATLARVNRGHGFAEFAQTMVRARRLQLPVCAHLIVGLPGEVPEMSLISLQRTLDEGVQGLKLHPLMIVKGSRLALAYRRGEVAPPSFADYVATVAEMIRRTPASIIYHRVAASARQATLLAPDWCAGSQVANNAIAQTLARCGGQGSLTSAPYVVAQPRNALTISVLSRRHAICQAEH